ncbi:Hypothetical protein POVR2_LOCUS34 [uncultured virus]|nr:Hypothetical protein POVR2_LOCUS34 [uncultured virus]
MDCGLLDPSEYNDNGLGSLRRGCKLGYCQVVRRCLVDWKLDPTEAEPSCLEVACWYGQVEIVKLLLADTRVDPSVEDSRPFMIAYLRGRSAVLEVLMADGRCDINMQEGQVPADKVELPHETEYLKIARLLLSDTRFNPASNNSWYLTYSSVLGHASVVQLLLGDGRADPRALNYRAVYQAWNRGHKETLDILLADPRVDIGTRMQYNGTLTVLCCVGNILLGTAIGMTILYAARHISMTIDRQAHLLHNLPLLLAVQLDSYDKLGE